ncbi:hypothetical protein BDW74DRAFT_170364 [Aspergillus multicolor]|uniref:uncharacterized protein n=1 Tax=Aspergillus multicolor TaxID=41759 RepID=UPI003CCCCB7D
MGHPKGQSSKIEKSSPKANKQQKAKREALKQVLAIARTELETDPHGRYGILSYSYDDTGDSLEDQVKYLKERVRDLEVYVRNSIRAADWLEGDFLEDIFYATWNLAQNLAIDDIAGLSKKQKDRIVASLEGWLVQEDLDSIHARLQPAQQDQFGKALFEAFLNKAVVDILFRHPFWHLDEAVDEAGSHDDNAWGGVSPLGDKLETLLSKFEKVGMEYAQVWRSITTRVANSVEFGQTRDFALEKAMKARRDAQCKALAAHLLSNEALTPRPGFHTLANFGATFSGSSDTMWVDDLCTPKDGHRVLGLTRPFVIRTVNAEKIEKEIEPVAEAVVFIEDESLDADAEPSGKAGTTGPGQPAKGPKA